MLVGDDESRHAISAVKKNLIKTKLKNAQLIQATASSHLLRCQKSYDLIFADPPYYKSSTDQNHIEELLHCEHLIQRLKPSGYLILEMSSKQQLPESALLETVTHRQYGATSVLFLTRR